MSTPVVDPFFQQAELTGDELGVVPIPILDLYPAPENEKLYRPVRDDDPDVIALAQSIRERGIIEPLVISLDGYILSGHRRHVAALLAGLTEVPCRHENIRRILEPVRFLRLLAEYNRQRVKNFAEMAHEAALEMDPDAAYAVLDRERKKRAQIRFKPLKLQAKRVRAAISDAKRPFLDAVLKVLKEYRSHLPVSERQIHYALLNNPPLKHAGKPGSVYKNDHNSAKALSELATRGRIEGLIEMDDIDDETRPETLWRCHNSSREFLRSELKDLLGGYWRDPLQSQPNHIELLVEKNTVANILHDVASEFAMPMTSGRGFASLPPRWKMCKRYQRSGKQDFILIIVSDFDPAGEAIAESYPRSMRDDFKIRIHPIKAALTYEQVRRMNLPSSLDVKAESSHAKRFFQLYGRTQQPYELEALAPDVLQQIVRETIDSVLDFDLYNAEVQQAHEDARQIAGARTTISELLKDFRFEDDDWR
jgi:hypothetical protein